MHALDSLLPELTRRPGAFLRTGFTDSARPDTLCYAATAEYLATANDNPNVACVIASPDLASAASARLGLAVSADPAETFFRLHNRLAGAGALALDMPQGVSPLARVHASAVIEPGVCIEAGAEIGALAFVGAGSWIEADALVGPGARIGVEGHFFKRYQGRLLRIRHAGGVRIGARSHVLANAIVQRALFADFTEVGPDTVMGPATHIGHGAHIGAGCTIAGSVQVAGYSRIGDEVWIGPGAVIGNLLTIGDGARVEIGAVVVASVAAGARVSGAFARPHVENLRLLARQRLEAARGRSRADT